MRAYDEKVSEWKMTRMNATAQKILAMRVARAAPITPRAGRPKWPKMSTQFRKMFRRFDVTVIHIACLVSPIPSAKNLDVKKNEVGIKDATVMK